jgi:TfoX/Sxy family transcriptional regulator of competence genes
MAYDEQTAERVRKALSGRRDVTVKKMMGGLAFMVKGSMCCSVSGRGGMLIRVGADEAVFAEPHVRRVKMGARTMSGFVRVDPEGYTTDLALKRWVQRGLDAVASLPVDKARKPGARKAPKRAARISKRRAKESR